LGVRDNHPKLSGLPFGWVPVEVGTMKQPVSLRGGVEYKLCSIEAHHRQLDERLRELGRRPFLTPKEQLEVAEIKKHKLRAKDEITALRRGL
jgi:hypothetical protein